MSCIRADFELGILADSCESELKNGLMSKSIDKGEYKVLVE